MNAGESAHWQITLAGLPLPKAAQAGLLELEVFRRLEHASRFCLKLSDPDCALADGQTFQMGAAVEITLRHGGREAVVFDGELTAWGLECTSQGTSLLVRGLDRSHRLLRSRRIRFEEASNDAALVRALAQEQGLRATPGPSSPPNRQVPAGVLQFGTPDLGLLLARGARHAITPAVEGKMLRMAPASYAQPARTLQPDEVPGRFELEVELSGLPTRVEVVGWDMRQHRRIEGKAAAMDLQWSGDSRKTGLQQAKRAFGDAVHILAEHAPKDAQEATKMARAYLQHRVERTLQGVIWVSGFPAIAPGQRIKLDAPTLPVPGTYRVLAVHHLLTPAGGSTRLEVVRPQLQSL